ncbi:5-amino-6-(5-phosphoribosylamino)uracil reductase [Planosporangium mesophilum]|uniref:Riboflavin biosynthesis protein RibD n=1 Tax=Planosporangium mesophilum TaxID=689768 RepID=A0A8J3X2B5_9ACTN|nr:5-amino-6-(5-phosphoribosylamino)uracil reductase [Planosporangium mesophilum]GII25327.1 5-amino-6-(5-phosphoribosylamino)uracil reductase [Planosporangium mesophilum]
MTSRPYTLLSCAVSIDGYLDDSSEQRLLLSNGADFDAVDEARAGCDAILVGANTVRRDDPRLVIRDPARRADRVARGLPPDPLKATVTTGGDLDPGSRFFTVGESEKLVYSPSPPTHLDGVATVVPAGDLRAVLADLAGRGVRRLMVEGGATILAALLADGLADELRLAIAPRFVGDPAAPRFNGCPGRTPVLAGVTDLDGVAVLRYLLSQAAVDRHWLEAAIDEARRCPPSRAAFSVGAVIVDAAGREISRGYSRESDPVVHAEESALAKVDPADPRLAGATIYSSLEPCSVRRSRPASCAALIRAAGIPRVVYAWREPVLFVDGEGAEELDVAGVEVVQVPDLEPAARAVNAHLL